MPCKYIIKHFYSISGDPIKTAMLIQILRRSRIYINIVYYPLLIQSVYKDFLDIKYTFSNVQYLLKYIMQLLEITCD